MFESFFLEIQTNGFSVIDNFIDDEALRKIANWSGSLLDSGEFKKAKLSSTKLLNEEVRSDLTYWLDPLVPTLEWTPLRDIVDLMRDGLNERFYLGLKQYECHLAHYPIGGFYSIHLDQMPTGPSRIFTFILYLNENWDDNDGGELVIYNKQEILLKKITPRGGRLVGFMSADFPHEVRVSLKARSSFSGWIHNKLLY